MPGKVLNLDRDLLLLINNEWRSPLLDQLMPVVSSGPLLFGIILLLCAFWLLYARKRSIPWSDALRRLLLSCVLLGICVGASDLAASLVKDAADRPRPYQALPYIYHQGDGAWLRTPAGLIPRGGGSSFFSAHAANSMAVAVAAAIIFPPAAPCIYALPLAVGYSRIYLGRHYPSDVLTGWLAGWLIASFAGRRAWPRLRKAALRA